MIRLILQTGRFRNLGYEIFISGPLPSKSDYEVASRLCADLKSGSSTMGVGAVFQAKQAGRSIDETIGVLTTVPVGPEIKVKLHQKFHDFHRNLLPEILEKASAAVSVQEARKILQKELDGWAATILPWIEPGAGGHKNKPVASYRKAPSLVRLSIFSGLAILAALWFSSSWLSGQPVLQDSANPDQWYSQLNDDSEEWLKDMLPEPFNDSAVIESRRSIVRAFTDLKTLMDVIDTDQLMAIERSLPASFDTVMFRFLRSVEMLEIKLPGPTSAFCVDACEPSYSESDVDTLKVLHEFYSLVAEIWSGTTDVRAPDVVFNDIAGYQDFVKRTGWRRSEITLRGELHKKGLGQEASDLLDPLTSLLNCETPDTCRAVAASNIFHATVRNNL